MTNLYRFPAGGRLNRNSWGPMSAPPQNFNHQDNDDDFLDERMLSSQYRQLFPLQEDLAEWINKTIGIDYITGENFFDILDNGVVVCHLGKVIQEKIKEAIDNGLAHGPLPVIRGKIWENAMRRSFFSRDNMENFIKFCRSLGVHENLLFESDDLVLHNQPRNVILCLLEVARLASRFGVEPPGLVQLEKEIAAEEEQDSGLSHSSLLSWQFQASSPTPIKMRHSNSSSAISAYARNWSANPRSLVLMTPEPPPGTPLGTPLNTSVVVDGGASDGVPSDTTEDEWSRGSNEDPDEEQPNNKRGEVLTELDRRVQHATRLMQKNCNCANGKCSKLKVRKVGEGKYNIAGRNVFIRLLKGRHMMVRVGGGWDTLDHFLLRHDPCQVKVMSREGTPTLERPPSAQDKYLHIRAKYKASPHTPTQLFKEHITRS